MARRINQTLTVNAGNPICLATGTTKAANIPVWISRYFVQMQHAGTGLGLVYDGVPATRTVASTDLTAELAAATATSPGGSYEDWDKSLDRGGIDANEVWIDGAHTGDTILASFVPRG